MDKVIDAEMLRRILIFNLETYIWAAKGLEQTDFGKKCEGKIEFIRVLLAQFDNLSTDAKSVKEAG